MGPLPAEKLSDLSASFRRHRELRDNSLIMRTARSAMDTIGSAETLGQKLVEDFEDARSRSPSLAHAYHKLLKEYLREHDQEMQEVSDLSNVDERDLKAYVTELAVQFMIENDEFRRAVLDEAVRRRPELSDQVERLDCDGG